MTTLSERHEEDVRQQADRARGMLGKFTNRAVEILEELAEYAENDRVRLSAVNSILDRAGVVAPQEIKISASQEEHDIVKSEVEDTMKKLQANVAQKELSTPKPSLEAVVLHESE